MADQPSSTAAKKFLKKGAGIVKRIRDLIKRPKPANDSASQSNSASPIGAHDSVPENDAESTEPAASRFFHLGVINDDLASGGNDTLNHGMYLIHNSLI